MTVLSMSKLTASFSSSGLGGHPFPHVGARPVHRGLHVGQPLRPGRDLRLRCAVSARGRGGGLHDHRGRTDGNDQGEEQSEQPRHAITVTGTPDAHPSNSSTQAGTSSPARPCRASSKKWLPSLGTRLSSSVRAPYADAAWTKPGRRVDRTRGADGHEQVAPPRARRRSGPARRGSRRTRPRRGAGPRSWQRRTRREVAQVALPRDPVPQARHSAERSSPCMCSTRVDPARSCRSSMFWVTTRRSSPSARLEPGEGEVGRVGLDRRRARPGGRRRTVHDARAAARRPRGSRRPRPGGPPRARRRPGTSAPRSRRRCRRR